MHRKEVSASFGPLFLSMFFLALTAATPSLHAQVRAASVTVRMLDAVDSSKDPAGKQYRASVTKAVDAGNGVVIPQGAAAAVTLTNSGSGWTTQLVSVTVNGQPVAVTSGSASVTAAAQSAAGAALSSVNSVLGGFGRHVNAPAAATAMATGQHVVLPPGVTLSFVRSQPPASSQPASAAPAAPASQPMIASSAPASHPAPGPSVAAAPGQHWNMCRYQSQKDPNNPALGSRMYWALVPSSALDGPLTEHFDGYIEQNYKIVNPGSGGTNRYCSSISDDLTGRTYSRDLLLKGWATNVPPIEAIQVDFADTPAQDAAVDARLASAAATAAANANERYVYCISGATGPAVYFSDIFMAVPTSPTFGPHAGRTGFPEFSRPFLTFLQKKYGYKDDPSNSPVTCRAQYNVIPAGLSAAQATKNAAQDLDKQANKQIVETGWKQ